MKVLAQQSVESQSYPGWWTGLIIGFAIVWVVVILVGTILMYASRIAEQAREGIARMDEARANTLPIWEIQDLNVAATGIWKAVESTRPVLEEKIR